MTRLQLELKVYNVQDWEQHNSPQQWVYFLVQPIKTAAKDDYMTNWDDNDIRHVPGVYMSL